jgi:hypothetical protein
MAMTRLEQEVGMGQPNRGSIGFQEAVAQSPWIGLTYEQESELIRLAHNHAGIRFYIRAAEAKLKELNT